MSWEMPNKHERAFLLAFVNKMLTAERDMIQRRYGTEGLQDLEAIAKKMA